MRDNKKKRLPDQTLLMKRRLQLPASPAQEGRVSHPGERHRRALVGSQGSPEASVQTTRQRHPENIKLLQRFVTRAPQISSKATKARFNCETDLLGEQQRITTVFTDAAAPCTAQHSTTASCQLAQVRCSSRVVDERSVLVCSATRLAERCRDSSSEQHNQIDCVTPPQHLKRAREQ